MSTDRLPQAPPAGKPPPLADQHLRELTEGSAISHNVVARAGLYSEHDARVLGRMVGHAKAWTTETLPALVFPCSFPGEAEPTFFRVKPAKPIDVSGKDEDTRTAKYLSPSGPLAKGGRLYFSPRARDSAEARANMDEDLYIAEGEKKALCLESTGLLSVGIFGVDNWHPKGTRRLVADFRHFALKGRRVFIVFDADAVTNINGVRRAERQLATALQKEGATVAIVRLPQGGPKGCDDFIADRGADAFHELVRNARAVPKPEEREHDAPKGPGGSLDDIGNARRFARAHGEDARYCYPWDKWLVWDRRKWTVDHTGEVMRRAKATSQSIYVEAGQVAVMLAKEREAAGYADEDAIAAHARASRSRASLANMVKLATSERPIPVLPKDFDRDEWAFNCTNGVIDLRTGEIRPHRRDDMLTKMSPVHYDPGAPCPLWSAHLERVFDHDQELIGFMRRWSGYCLTGSVAEQCLAFVWGKGANGKSVTVETLRAAMGQDYASTVPTSIIVDRRGANETHPAELATLHGIRLAICHEVEQGSWMAESKIKATTGGDEITCRRMREDFWTFAPTHKLMVLGNHKPRIKGQDEGIWRRILLVPFNVQIPKDQRDRQLTAKLRAELPGILAWAVRGAREWQRDGLNAPAVIADATRAYRDEQDATADFVTDCLLAKPKASTTAARVWAAYQAWCRQSGESEISRKDFVARLEDRGFVRGKSHGIKVWRDLEVLPDLERSDADDSDPGGPWGPSGTDSRHLPYEEAS